MERKVHNRVESAMASGDSAQRVQSFGIIIILCGQIAALLSAIWVALTFGGSLVTWYRDGGVSMYLLSAWWGLQIIFSVFLGLRELKKYSPAWFQVLLSLLAVALGASGTLWNVSQVMEAITRVPEDMKFKLWAGCLVLMGAPYQFSLVIAGSAMLSVAALGLVRIVVSRAAGPDEQAGARLFSGVLLCGFGLAAAWGVMGYSAQLLTYNVLSTAAVDADAFVNAAREHLAVMSNAAATASAVTQSAWVSLLVVLLTLILCWRFAGVHFHQWRKLFGLGDAALLVMLMLLPLIQLGMSHTMQTIHRRASLQLRMPLHDDFIPPHSSSTSVVWGRPPLLQVAAATKSSFATALPELWLDGQSLSANQLLTRLPALLSSNMVPPAPAPRPKIAKQATERAELQQIERDLAALDSASDAPRLERRALLERRRRHLSVSLKLAALFDDEEDAPARCSPGKYIAVALPPSALAHQLTPLFEQVQRAGICRVRILTHPEPQRLRFLRRRLNSLSMPAHIDELARMALFRYRFVEVELDEYAQPSRASQRPPLALSVSIQRDAIALFSELHQLGPPLPNGAFAARFSSSHLDVLRLRLLELKDAFPDEKEIYLHDFARDVTLQRVVQLVDQARLPRRADHEAQNLFTAVWLTKGYKKPRLLSPHGLIGASGRRTLSNVRGRRQSYRMSLSPVIEVHGIAKPIVRSVIQHHQGQLRYCFERMFSSDGTLSGSIVLKQFIERSGRPVRTQISKDTIGVPQIGRCMQVKLQTWNYPPLPQAAHVQFEVHFQRAE